MSSRLSMIEAIVFSWKEILPNFKEFEVSEGWYICSLFDIGELNEEELEYRSRKEVLTFCSANGVDIDDFEIKSMKGDCDTYCLMIRPISLSALDTNNGWIHLNHSRDLPSVATRKKFECGKLSFKGGCIKWEQHFDYKGSSLIPIKRIRELLRDKKVTHIKPYIGTRPVY